MIWLSPRNFTRVGPHVYFTATTFAQGTELWRPDGTAAGTSLAKDIYAGPINSNIANLIVGNGLLYFTANNGISGNELWRSDGTAEGTFQFADIVPGYASPSLLSLTPAICCTLSTTRLGNSGPALVHPLVQKSSRGQWRT